MARAALLQEVEAPPEADRLEGYPHPRATGRLFGHAGAERVLADAFAGGRMHHGWLITGPLGIGKATLAYRFAKHVLASPPERNVDGPGLDIATAARAARQVLALSHPGLLLLRRIYDPKNKKFGVSIPVDEVRRLKGFLAHTADGASWRVVVVDAADDLNVNAANALLKSLEEPPQRTVFLLISSEPGRLLATIRSRCRTLALEPLKPEDLRSAVQQAVAAAEDVAALGPQDWARLADLSHGSPRRALALASGDGVKMHERVAGLVSALPRVDWQAVHTLSDELAGAAAEQRFLAFYEVLFDTVHRLIRAQATGAGSDLALAGRLIGAARLPRWAEAWEAIGREKSQCLALNLDRKALILATVARLEQAAHG